MFMIPAKSLLEKDFGYFTRDPTATAELAYYAGYISSIGVIAWTTAAVVALFTSFVLISLESKSSGVWFLFYFGCLTALLGFDDLFLLHENYIRNEKILFFIYGLMVLVGCILFWREFKQNATGYAIAAGIAFAISLAIDLNQYSIEPVIGEIRIFFEDGAKFLGTVCWMIFICKVSTGYFLESSRT